MYSIQIKNKALKLRRHGKSIYDIAKILNLKPTTISNWCKNILLTEELKNKISQNGKLKARAAMLEYTEKLREERQEREFANKKLGIEMVSNLSLRDILMVGLGLYWGEGYKYENSELGFTNSNPKMIYFYLKWLEIFGVKNDDLIFRLTINEMFRKREDIIKDFWVTNLKINKNQFSATTFIQTNLKKGDIFNTDTYLGILRVKVRKGTDLRNRIMGAIEHLSSCPLSS